MAEETIEEQKPEEEGVEIELEAPEEEAKETAPETTKGPFTVTQSTEKVSTRAKGRQIALKWQSTGTLDQWTLGDSRINTREDGLR